MSLPLASIGMEILLVISGKGEVKIPWMSVGLSGLDTSSCVSATQREISPVIGKRPS
jgi:hypothetical protein